jgi:hypothetical protein
MKKYTHYKIIQGNYGFGWDDEDFHQTNSQGAFENKEARESFRFNLKAYRENGGGAYRVIQRREFMRYVNPA